MPHKDASMVLPKVAIETSSHSSRTAAILEAVYDVPDKTGRKVILLIKLIHK